MASSGLSSFAADRPVPETAETTALQLAALADGRTKAVLVTPGTKMPAVPSGYTKTETKVGTWIHDPALKSSTIKKDVGNGSYGQLLGHMEPKSPATNQIVTAVQNGIEAKSSMVSPENAEAQAGELQRQFPQAQIVAGGNEIVNEVLGARATGNQPPSTDLTKEIPPPEPEKLIAKNPYDPYIAKAADLYNLDPYLIKSVITQESGWNEKATGPATKYGSAKGLMQLIDSTAKEMGVTDPYDPVQNILGGSKYLRKMLDRYNGNTMLALAAYNAGPGNVDKYGGIPPFKETLNYTAKISQNYKKQTGKDISGATGGLETLEAVASETPSNTLVDILLSPFVSVAQAEESTEHRRATIKKNLLQAKEFMNQKGGWDKLTPKQQQLITTQINAYKSLEPKSATQEKIHAELEDSKAEIKKAGIHVNYGDHYGNFVGNTADLLLGPAVISSEILNAAGIDVPDQVKNNLNITSSFKRSFFEKFIESATLGFLQGNLEKPIDEQTFLEKMTGMAGSVLGTVVGYTFPLTAPAKIMKGAKALLPMHRTIREAMAMFGIGAMEGVSHGNNPIEVGAKYAAFPLAAKGLGMATGAAQKLHQSLISRWVTRKFVPPEMGPMLDLAKKAKTFGDFKQAFVGMKDSISTAGKYFAEAKAYKGTDAKVLLKEDLQKFYNQVKGGKIDSLADTLRPFINNLLKSKKQIKLANNIEKIVQAGGEALPPAKGPIRTFFKGLADYGVRSLAGVLKKVDPVNGTKFEMTVENYARQYRYALGTFKGHLDDMLKGVSDKDFSTATKILERKLTQAEYAKLSPDKFIELATLAKNLDRTLKAVGRRLVKAGVTFKEPTVGNVDAHGLIKHYFPHRFTEEQLHKFKQMDATDVVGMGEFLVKTKQAPDLDTAVKMWKGYVDGLAYKQPMIGKKGFEHTRLNVPGYRTDKGSLYEHMNDVAQRVAFAENFGPNGEKLLETGVLLKRHGADATFVDEAVNRVLGVETKHFYTKVFHLLRQVNTFLFSPATTALNLSQRSGIAIEGGMKGFAQGLAAKQQNARLILKSGAMDNKVLDDIKKMQLGTVDADNWVSKTQDKFLTALGWKHVEVGNRSHAASSGIENIKRLVEGLKANPKDTLYRRMAEQLIGKDKLGQVMKRGFLNQQELVRAAQTLEKDTQFWYLATDLPLFFTSDAGKVITQFKASAYLYSSFLKRQVYDEAKKGNVVPLFYWMTLGSASNEVVADIRDVQKLQDPFDPSDPLRAGLDNLPKRAVQNLFFEGQGMGLVSDVANAFRYYKQYKYDSIFNEMFAGPSISRGGQLFKAFADYWAEGKTQGLTKFALGFAPGISTTLRALYAQSQPKKAESRKDKSRMAERNKMLRERKKQRQRR